MTGTKYDHIALPSFSGMFNNYAAILSKWDDTTNFDNVRGPALPQDGLSVAGGTVARAKIIIDSLSVLQTC